MLTPERFRRIATAARRGKDWTRRRDEEIIEALKDDATQEEVAAAAGLTQPAVSGIWKRYKASIGDAEA